MRGARADRRRPALSLHGESRAAALAATSSRRREAPECLSFPFRKTVIFLEEIHHEGGPAAATAAPARRRSWRWSPTPSPGATTPDLQPAMETLKPLGLQMTDRLIAALGGRDGIDAYGKGAIVGEAGELEHGALWHVPGGYAMRERLGEAQAIVPSAMKVGGLGARLDVPLGHINAAYVRSHFDAMEVGLPDAPRAGRDRVRAGDGPRRAGACPDGRARRSHEVKGEDGLR